MVNLSRHGLGIAAIVAASVGGCQRSSAPSTGLKSLDNLVADTEAAAVVDTCGPRMDLQAFESLPATVRQSLPRVDAPNDDLRLAAVGAYSAVPKPLQAMFADANGSILVSKDAAAICGSFELAPPAKLFAGKGTASKSCWRRLDGRLELVLPADPAAIRHATVRLVSYIYTTVFVHQIARGSLTLEARQQIEKGLTRFSEQRAALTTGLLSDVKGRSQSARLASLAQSDGETFGDFVVAEALDSYYCSAESRSRFRERFAATYRVFTAGDLALQHDFKSAFFD